MTEIKTIKKAIPHIGEKMCEFLNIELSNVNELMSNFTIESKLSGHNNEISILGFYNIEKTLLSRVCLKYTYERKKMDKLQIECVILKILKSKNFACPTVIDAGSKGKDALFILMEKVNGTLASDLVIDISTAELVLDAILLHESILLDNIDILQSYTGTLDLHQVIDFEKKLTNYLNNFTSYFKIKDSFNFLNSYLSNFNSNIKRSIVTDRSTDNIFIGKNNKIIMIDFSTLRIGTQFDNWIQFIDDPKARFSCSKEELIKLFFIKQNLQEDNMDCYYAASIYTNLLQGIFTNKKNPELGGKYINNANDAFEKFNKKKGVLIEIVH